ncbi:MAG: DUF1566 domain-containing protein [Candidatus Lindowbacteria bacterium]|nr:DUF1566 domain-containing protein [Candidatus Lindowbacteria bacterium]
MSYPIVDTGQAACYDDMAGIGCPGAGEAFSGQDAQHDGNQPDHTDNGNGTVTDNVTGLMWQQGFADTKLTYAEAQTYVNALNTQHYCGYSDWRLPTIKELYSLIDFRGTDPPPERTDITGLVPFIDTDYFDFAYGHIEAGERIIDSQWVTRTLYTANANMVFGVNFADGRIKGYGMASPDPLRPEMRFYVRLCRGNTNYGTNSLVNNNDGTVTDVATGLMWTQSDSGQGMIWEDALAWVEQKNAENYLGHSDWRLPNAKELQSIVDYTRSPDTTGSAAISPVFSVTEIINLAGEIDYPYFWTGTTHVSSDGLGARAVYVAFGRGLGEIHGEIVDIHGAGCQRSDPKFGEEEDFPASGFGPQGDVRCVFNYVRCVRGAESELARINLTSPADGSALHYAPTFTWIPDGGTDNRYVVDFRVPGLVSLRTTPVLSSPSWTMPNAMEFRPAWCKGILASASN